MAASVTTTDLYEASFYLLAGCEIEGIEAERQGEAIICRLTFRGEKLLDLQRRYFAGEGAVPIYAFRRTFGRVNALVRTAKKKAKSRLERERSDGVGL